MAEKKDITSITIISNV